MHHHGAHLILSSTFHRRRVDDADLRARPAGGAALAALAPDAADAPASSSWLVDASQEERCLIYKVAYPVPDALSAARFAWDYLGRKTRVTGAVACGELQWARGFSPGTAECDFQLHFVEPPRVHAREAVNRWSAYWHAINGELATYNAFMNNAARTA